MNARQRIIEFFQRNPTEELSKSDMAIKWDLSERSLDGALANLCSERHLYNRWLVEDEGKQVVYGLISAVPREPQPYRIDGRMIPTL